MCISLKSMLYGISATRKNIRDRTMVSTNPYPLSGICCAPFHLLLYGYSSIYEKVIARRA